MISIIAAMDTALEELAGARATAAMANGSML